MSEVKISVGMDVSQAEAAAAALPDSIDRKLRSKKRGDFTQGYTDISAKGTKFIDPKDAMGRTANDLKMAQEAEKKKQQAISETANDSKKWIKDFGSELGGTLMQSIGPAAIALKTIQLGWGYVFNRIALIYGNYESKITAGVDPKQVEAFQMFTGVGTTTNDQAAAMAARAQGVANANATGGPGANTKGFEYFGMTDYKRYREQGLPLAELLVAMTKKFKTEGGSPRFGMAAESIFGSDWPTMKGMFAKAATFKNKAGKDDPYAMYDYLSQGGAAAQSINAARLRTSAMKMSQKDLMGGIEGGLPQMLEGVTSLQSMGGGDVLSALARGPQDLIVQNTERTADASEALLEWYESTMGETQTGIVLK